MPRLTRDQLEQAVISALPADGSFMPYAALVEDLESAGNYAAIQLLRGMKMRGEIKMRVRATETGSAHEVAKGEN